MFFYFIFVLLSLLGTFNSVTTAATVAITEAATLASPLPVHNPTHPVPALLEANNTIQLNTDDRTPDSEMIASYLRQGLCFSYLGRFCTDSTEGWNRNKTLAACEIYCPTQAGSDGYGVSSPLPIGS